MKIIYEENGKVCVIHPSPAWMGTMYETMYALALKDVPYGVPFQIVDDAFIPVNRNFRDAWKITITQPDGVGANFGVEGKYQVSDFRMADGLSIYFVADQDQNEFAFSIDVNNQSIHPLNNTVVPEDLDIIFKPIPESKSPVTVDMVEARDIHRDRIRQARVEKFKENDIALQDALANNDIAALEMAKQKRDALRNMPQDERIDKAQTPEELLKI